MCVRVQYVSSYAIPYDDDRNVINIPAHLDGPFALAAIRKVLAELAADQPESGARCWCGEPVRLLNRVPKQQENGDQVVIRHGA